MQGQDSSARKYEDVLGTFEKTSTAYGFDLTCKPNENRQLSEMLNESMKKMPQVEDKRPSSYFIENGNLKFFDVVKVEHININIKDRAQMLMAMNMRDALRKVIDVQVNDGSDDELEKAQTELNHDE